MERRHIVAGFVDGYVVVKTFTRQQRKHPDHERIVIHEEHLGYAFGAETNHPDVVANQEGDSSPHSNGHKWKMPRVLIRTTYSLEHELLDGVLHQVDWTTFGPWWNAIRI